MKTIAEVYSLFSDLKECCYNDHQCAMNIEKFLDLIRKENQALSENRNNFWVLIINADANSATRGPNWKFHVVLLYFDKKINDWYILDFDSEAVVDIPPSEPITAMDYLKKNYCNNRNILSSIEIALYQKNYYSIRFLPKFSIITSETYKYLLNANIITQNTKTPEDQEECSSISLFHLFIYNSFNPEILENEKQSFIALKQKKIGYNNLGEFILFLLSKNPESIKTLEQRRESCKQYEQHTVEYREDYHNPNTYDRLRSLLQSIKFWIKENQKETQYSKIMLFKSNIKPSNNKNEIIRIKSEHHAERRLTL